MTKEKVIPQIRFSGFTDTWEQRKLGECAEFNPKSELPDIFEYVDLESVVGTDILSHRTESKSSAPSRAQRLAQKGDVFYQTVRPYQKNNCIFENDENNWVFSTGYAQLRPVNDGYFLLTLLQNEDFVKLVLDRCTGTSYPAINSNDLADIDVNIPINNLEQQRIGDYFRNLDSLITLHQRKYDKLTKVKKAMLEKMFPENGSPYPEIRFKGFTDAWEQRKLSDMVERVTRKNENLESELPLTISAQYGLIDQNEFFDKRIASRDVSGYYLLKKGEFAYNKSTSSDAPWGAVKRLDRYEMGVLSTLYIVFALKEDGNIDSDFLVSYYDTDCWHKGVQAIAAEGARNHGLLNITPADYFETVLTVPSNVKEQHQIGTFFAKLDSLITLHQRKLEKLKNIKKACLEKMFV